MREGEAQGSDVLFQVSHPCFMGDDEHQGGEETTLLLTFGLY